jgi:hypothetical protein
MGQLRKLGDERLSSGNSEKGAAKVKKGVRSQTLHRRALLLAAILLLVSGLVAGCTTEQSPEEIWLDGLITDLENDTTDQNEYIVNVYDDECFAEDLEDNLEGLGYDVTFLTVFEFDGVALPWAPLLEVRYSDDFAVLVNPRTDDIVTEAYDGDNDGSTETLLGMNVTDVSSWFDYLVATGLGNDGQYLILGFDDYDTVELVDTTVGKNITDLQKDLAANNVSERTYIEDIYDCEDFARDLEDDLEALGYRVTIKLVYYWAWNGTAWEWHGHVVVNVHLDDRVVTIEPRNDKDVTSTYDGDGDGTVETWKSMPKITAQRLINGFKRELLEGSDGPYMILEYEDFDQIPLRLDPPKNK